ncbi:MAG: MFS transporter [Desulfobacteraceae bacterium]|nr:MFS transporter [Desulfobacteraceae bacterium]
MQTDAGDYRRKWFVMASVLFGSFMIPFDLRVVNAMLPTIAHTFEADFAIVQWVILALIFPVATLTVSISRISDIFGKKPVYLAGFFLFSSGSFLCGMAPAIKWLIGFRIIQGTGAAMTSALGIAILTEAFPPNEHGKGLGLMVAAISAGSIAGPISGGILTDFFSWRFIFFADTSIGITGMFMVMKFIAHAKPLKKPAFDYTGAALIFISLLSLLLAMTFGQKAGFGNLVVLMFFTSFFLFFLIFVIVEFRTKDPVIDMKLFANNFLTIGVINALANFIGIGGFLFLIPFYLTNVLLFAPLETGLLLGIGPVAMAMSSPVSGLLSDRFGARIITIISLFILIVGYYTISTLSHETGIAGFIVRTVPLSIGIGVFMASDFSSITGAVPAEQRGTAAALIPLINTNGHMIGTSVMSSLWAVLVSYYANGIVYAKVTVAPPVAQVSALQDIFLLMMFVNGLLLVLNIFSQISFNKHP